MFEQILSFLETLTNMFTMKSKIFSYSAIACFAVFGLLLFYQSRTSLTYVENLDEGRVESTVEKILSTSTPIDLSQIFSKNEIPAFLVQSFWKQFRLLHLETWLNEFSKTASDLQLVPRSLRMKLIDLYCTSERLFTNSTNCLQLIDSQRQGPGEIVQKIKHYIHILEYQQARFLFDSYFKDDKTGCMNGAFQLRDQFLAVQIYQISGEFKKSGECLKYDFKDSKSEFVNYMIQLEAVKLNLLSGKKLIATQGLEDLPTPPSPLLNILTKQLIVLEKVKSKQTQQALDALNELEQVPQLKNLVTIADSLSTLKNHLKDPSKPLEKPKNYYQWLVFQALK